MFRNKDQTLSSLLQAHITQNDVITLLPGHVVFEHALRCMLTDHLNHEDGYGLQKTMNSHGPMQKNSHLSISRVVIALSPRHKPQSEKEIKSGHTG